MSGKPLRVLMLWDRENFGGAAVAAYRLAQGIEDLGHDVLRVVAERTGPSSRAVKLVRQMNAPFAQRLAGVFWPARRRKFTERNVTEQLEKLIARHQPDVINIHNLHFAAQRHHWSMDLVRTCARHAPTVWTLHDMWSFTGRCSYAYDCLQFREGCSASCPTHDEYPELQPREIAPAWSEKKAIVDAFPSLTAVTPSRWLGEEARSGIWGDRVNVIPGGIPLEAYTPVPVEAARRALNIDPAAKVFAVVAQTLTARRKGGQFLAEALRLCSTRPIVLLCMGQEAVPLDLPGVTCIPLGYVPGGALQALVYGAADVLLHPAAVDNLPNVVIEAMACGTPTVAFPVGGLPELVRPGRTGWLASEVSAKSFAAAIDQAAATPPAEIELLRRNCRDTAVAEYNQDLTARRYAALFQQLAGGSPERLFRPEQGRTGEAAA